MFARPKTLKEKAQFAAQLKAYKKEQDKLVERVVIPLTEYQSDLSTAIIVDIDGTLAQRGERGVFDFDLAVEVDEPIEATKVILQKFANDVSIILLTGREEQFREATKQWLTKWEIPFHDLIMRQTADRRGGADVKEELWAGHIRNKYNILFVLENDPKCVDMFRSRGMYCFQVDRNRK